MIIEKETIHRIHYEMALSRGTFEISEVPEASETYCVLKSIDNTVPGKPEITELCIPIELLEALQGMINTFSISHKNNKEN